MLLHQMQTLPANCTGKLWHLGFLLNFRQCGKEAGSGFVKAQGSGSGLLDVSAFTHKGAVEDPRPHLHCGDCVVLVGNLAVEDT